ncbi:Protein SET DOMAIN GROUP 41 [Striga hermonthica]|uniref:Protein SET DOMAIN GROUP 41 n=1 Tax=Striga hermonthica TaxID=68872 RepID=A0A9N7R5R9_STRHE|nr:Protein SET DOMAIN GROUP 41 [Striga hermonthica]
MELRATEDIAIGQNLTSPLRPLAAVLRDSALTSYCSACFSALPSHPFPLHSPTNPHHDSPTPLYCSPGCSSADSPLHLSSGEAHLFSLFLRSPPSTWIDSSDLRLSLRLVSIFQKLPQKSNLFHLEENDAVLERIAGLMTNRERLVCGPNRNNEGENCVNYDNSSERIREGAMLLAKARKACLGESVNVHEPKSFMFEEMALCLVLTNAVEVQDESGYNLGVAVYGPAFSWINHSCSPNACYRFSVGPQDDERSPLRTVPAVKNGGACDLMVEGDLQYPCLGDVEENGYGPSVIVRSIKDVRKGEEVTIAYTDLLQPKDMRRAELWSKYRFSCSCKRCNSVPPTYVDNALQALSAGNCSTIPEPSDTRIERLMQSFNEAIADYLSFDDPISCCKKLENLLLYGDSLQPNGSKSPQKPKLNPLHHLSLNAYTTLASAYKVHANDLMALHYDVERHNRGAFNMYKTSAAYSLLLAGGAHHLYAFEPALIATASNFWINAGESILNFARNSLWDTFLNSESAILDFSSVLTKKCNTCSLADILEPKSVGPDRNKEFEDIKGRLYNCIADITPKVWGTLAYKNSFLKGIKNPVNFSWLEVRENRTVLENLGSEAEECNNEHVWMNLVLLGVHCLRFGALLSSICYGLSAETNPYYETLAIFKESA